MLKLGSILAWFLTVAGGMRVAFGLLLALGVSAEDNAAAARMILAAANTGEAINEGMVALVVGVVIGLLVKIAKNTAPD